MREEWRWSGRSLATRTETARARSNDKYFVGQRRALALDCSRLCDLPPKCKEWQVTDGRNDGAELLGWEHTELGQKRKRPVPPVGV